MPYQISVFDYAGVITTICKLVGHPVQPDPAGSADPAVQQMGSAANLALGELLTMHEWQDLTVRADIPVVADFAGQKEKAFPLPPDYYRFIDQTQWSSQSMLPAGGPISPQAWIAYNVQGWSPQLTLYWQIREDQLWIMSPPFPTPATFSFFYISRGQVIDQDDPTLLKNLATKNGDKFKLDSVMIMLLGRARYLEWKGFDASAATRDFLSVYNSRAGADKGSPVLSMSRSYGFPLITPMSNLPVTGYGS